MSSVPVNGHSSDLVVGEESPTSGISWAAILGGAFVASALSLILLALGAGLGLSAVSPWQNSGISATTFSLSAAIWLIVIQIIAFGAGGYVAGRLRTKWSGIDTDEVYFRDTAHGLLVWAVGAVLGASLLFSAAAAIIGGGAQVAGGALSGAGGAIASAAKSAAPDSGQGDPMAYLVDSLFRTDRPAAPDRPGNEAGDQAVRTETGRILATSLANGGISPSDKAYLAQVVGTRTGLSPDQASKRVDDLMGQAKAAADKAEQTARQAADAARKAGSYLSLWTFIAMLIGAFSASYAATIGGGHRERVVQGRSARF